MALLGATTLKGTAAVTLECTRASTATASVTSTKIAVFRVSEVTITEV